jgi:hypothetical protein
MLDTGGVHDASPARRSLRRSRTGLDPGLNPYRPRTNASAARRRIVGGAAAAGLLLAMVLALPGPARLNRGVYDGIAPMPPYQWVRPPRELARDNRPPQSGRGVLDLDPSGRSPGSVATGDGQCTVIFNDGAVAAHPGAVTLLVSITPVDPAAIAPPPAGMRFDGNACRFEAREGPGGAVPRYGRTLTVVLRYASGGTQMVQASGEPPTWRPLKTIRYTGHLHLLVADTPSLGTFAPVAPAGTPYVQPIPWTLYAAAAAVTLGAAAAVLITRRRRTGGVRRGGVVSP